MSEGNRQDYPEHLNPFKPRRRSISKSFRKVFSSFTGKDKQRPEQHLEFQQYRHTVQPTTTNPQHYVVYSPTALPRSRFKERLQKTENLKRTSRDKYWFNDQYNAINPFDETEKDNACSVEDKPPVPALRTKNRKRKKGTAPLPPPLSGNGHYLTLPSRNGSKWSLTSTDTEASSLGYSEYEELEQISEKNREILEITKKIAEFTDDSNNNFTIIVANDITIKVEDIDPSSLTVKKIEDVPPQDKNIQPQENNIQPQEDNIQPQEPTEDNNIQDDKEDIKPEKEENAQPEKEEIMQQEENIQPEKEENIQGEKEENKEKQEGEPCLPHEEQINEKNIKLKEEDKTTKEEKIKDENPKDDKIEKEIPKLSNTNGCVKNNETGCDNDQKIDHIKKSLLRVRIIDNQEVVLRHPVDFPEDDLSTENYSIKQKIEHFESYRNSSPPKIRQTILTKDKLLGTE